jgi:hypothetical protein
MCPDVHGSSRFAVPDNLVKQVFEGRPMMLALLCGGLRRHYAPVAEDLPRGSVERLRHKAAYPTIFAIVAPSSLAGRADRERGECLRGPQAQMPLPPC